MDAKFEVLKAEVRAGDDRVLATMRKDLSDLRRDVNSMAWKLFAIVAVLVLVLALVVPLVTLR